VKGDIRAAKLKEKKKKRKSGVVVRRRIFTKKTPLKTTTKLGGSGKSRRVKPRSKNLRL